MKVLIINGPNLNLLGSREPSIYGDQTFEEILSSLQTKFPAIELEHYQSNVEGYIVDKLQTTDASGIILNAGGYTHTSVAIRDCIVAIKKPVIEVHISNITSRESFRHTSLISPVATGCIFGFGMKSYELALHYFAK